MDLNFGGKAKKEEQQQPEQQGFDPAKLYLWVKALESKINNLLREVDLIKNDFIKKNNEVRKELKTFNEDLLDSKHKQDKTIEKIDLIIKELKQTAGVEEVQTLKKYMELWSPLNFVTQRDLDRRIEEKLNNPQYSKLKEVKKEETHSPFN
jgi:hypothetical protein